MMSEIPYNNRMNTKIIVIIVILLVLAGFAYYYFFMNEKEEIETEESVTLRFSLGGQNALPDQMTTSDHGVDLSPGYVNSVVIYLEDFLFLKREIFSSLMPLSWTHSLFLKH